MKVKPARALFLLTGILLMTIAFLRNWSWNVYDMDDGSTIAYHTLGRDPAIQPPYNYYDSFSDYLLGFIPGDYYIFYAITVTWTFLSAIAIFILLGKLAKNFTGYSAYVMSAISLVFLFAMPDFLYLMLSYKSSLIGFAFVLCSHYLLVRNRANRSSFMVVIAALLFGFGSACRWNLIVYGLAIFADLLLRAYKKKERKHTIQVFVWAGVSLLSFLLFVYVSGYSATRFMETAVWGRQYMSSADYQLTALVAESINLFTPVMLLSLLIAMVICMRKYKEHSRVLLFFIVSLLPFFYLSFIPNLKYMITLLSAVFVLFAIGLQYLYHRILVLSLPLKIVFAVTLMLPWFLGIKVHSSATLWGPGFEIKDKAPATINFNSKLDERAGGNQFKVGLYDGFAITTAEGTKPLWGNFFVLYGGKLKALNTKIGAEVDTVIAIAARERIDIYTDRMDPVLLAGHCKMLFRTTDSAKQSGASTIRMFTREGQNVAVKRFNVKKDITDYTKVKELISTKRFVAHFTYTSLMADFIRHAPEHSITVVRQIGPFSGLFEIADQKN